MSARLCGRGKMIENIRRGQSRRRKYAWKVKGLTKDAREARAMQILRLYFKKNGLTQAEIGKQLLLSQGYVCKVVQGVKYPHVFRRMFPNNI